jgi:hypothetical protein
MNKIVVLALAVGAGVLASATASATTSGPIFSGNGGKTLPPFTVSKPSTLFWTNNGGIFQTFPGGGSIHGTVNSQARSGWTYLPKGRYVLQVNAVGVGQSRSRTASSDLAASVEAHWVTAATGVSHCRRSPQDAEQPYGGAPPVRSSRSSPMTSTAR